MRIPAVHAREVGAETTQINENPETTGLHVRSVLLPQDGRRGRDVS